MERLMEFGTVTPAGTVIVITPSAGMGRFGVKVNSYCAF